MASEYDPLRPRAPLSGEATDLETVQAIFGRAASGYVSSPWPWISWAIVLPVTAVITPEVAAASGSLSVLLLWSVAILIGGAFESISMWKAREARESAARSDITPWVFKGQGNLSLIAIVLTLALAWQGMWDFLPAVWLLLIGHSFFVVGGLASRALKRGGLLYQLGGVITLLPRVDSLTVLAVTTALANMTIAVSLILGRPRSSRR